MACVLASGFTLWVFMQWLGIRFFSHVGIFLPRSRGSPVQGGCCSWRVAGPGKSGSGTAIQHPQPGCWNRSHQPEWLTGNCSNPLASGQETRFLYKNPCWVGDVSIHSFIASSGVHDIFRPSLPMSEEVEAAQQGQNMGLKEALRRMCGCC